MLTDHDALLAGVLADPAADLPRLVYADFLEESGDPPSVARAEFIRVQCEVAGGRVEPDRLATLAAREKVLLAGHAAGWLAPLKAKGEALQNAGTHGQFRRGFVELVWMPAAVYLRKADKLFARAPVRELRVTRVRLPELAELLAHPATGRLAALDVSDLFLGDAAAELLAGSPALVGLTTLRLRGCNVTDAGAAALAAAPAGWRPGVVDLAWNPIGPAGRGAADGPVRRGHVRAGYLRVTSSSASPDFTVTSMPEVTSSASRLSTRVDDLADGRADTR